MEKLKKISMIIELGNIFIIGHTDGRIQASENCIELEIPCATSPLFLVLALRSRHRPRSSTST